MLNDEAAIRETATEYAGALIGARADIMVPFFQLPCLVVLPERVMTLSTGAEIEELFSHLIERLKARGYARSEYIHLYVRQLSESQALTSGVIARYTASGEEFERQGATYIYRKTDDGWKIAVLVGPHDPDTVLGAL